MSELITLEMGLEKALELGKISWIAHQCNCKSLTAAGLARDLFKAYPDANIYKLGIRRIPGSIVVSAPIINMLAQVYPGRSSTAVIDSAITRERYFTECLKKLSTEVAAGKIVGPIGFPNQIGCGLGGGNWSHYNRILKTFENQMTIVICHLPELVRRMDGRMEALCIHGVGHAVKDGAMDPNGIHGCDGCCTEMVI